MDKVFVIGIDAGNLELIRKWLDDLPNFSRMLSEGASGKLESTIPSSTMPAWNCMFTGKNPGKFGIYGFILPPSQGEGEYRIASYMYQDSPSLWDILSDEGKKVGVVNVPTVFPPKEVNGFMVAGGLLTPLYKDTEYTFPPGLKRELKRVANGYELLPLADLRIWGKEREFLKRFKRNIEKQARAVKYLITNWEWDFLTYVFYATDSAQHYFWHHMDETHPRHDRRKSAQYRDAIKEVYQKVDAAIGDFLSVLPEDTTILIVSDHGTAPAYGNFVANAWLRDRGFLSYKQQGRDLKRALRQALIWFKDLLSRLLSPTLVELVVRCLPRRILKTFLYRELYRKLSQQFMESIDWRQTKAYSLGMGGIFINLEGREPQGIVKPADYKRVREELIAEFLKLKDPEGQKPVSQVFRKEEVYWGKHLDSAPDLFLLLERYAPNPGFSGRKVWAKSPVSGGHNRYGTFIAYGPQIRKGLQIENAKIYDITPTVLHLMGLAIPKDIDGRVLQEIFEEDSEPAKRPVAYQDVGEGERERVKDRIRELKRLGKV